MPSTRGDRPATMRQALIAAPDRLEIVTAPTPELQGADEVLIRTAACGICSGDLMPWYLAKKVGTVLGHEMVGWAAEVGAQVQGIRSGDLVFFHHHAPCMNCEHCRRAAFVHCARWRSSKIDPGGMAEWIRVPGGIVQNDAFTVNNLTPEQALFIEPLACCVKALGCVRDGIQGSTGIVIGCGVMGMLNLLAARGLGADRLYAVEPDPERRRRALEFGADAALPPDAAAREWQHRADWVMVGPGHPEVIRQSLAYVRPAGVAVLFTPTATGVKTELELGELYFREITLIPSYSCGPSDTLKAYNLLKEADLQVERLITHGFPLEQAQTAFDTARRGGSVLKVIVQMSEASNL